MLAMAACGVPAAEQAQSTVTPASSSPVPLPVESTATASPSPSATSSTPGEVSEEQQFSLDDVAEFDDGLLIEIAGAVADKARKTDRGAEATNGEIGTALFISTKTASVHVSNILAKLGVNGRGEAAALAHRLGLTAP